ncbi:MAG TPA: glycine betaine/L-proline ABC transporter permease ProW [Thiolinea sp.]|nr:glycine betaine/L-proline ABC transporter permease ProW [Thiolinea sp.]
MADNASNPWAAASGADQAAQTAPAGNAWTAPAPDAAANTAGSTDWLSSAPDAVQDSFNWLDPFREAVIPLDVWVNSGLTWVVDHLRPFFQAIRWPIDATLTGIQTGLQAVPAPVLILLIALLAWQVSSWRLALGSTLSLIFVGLIGAWEESVITLALVITAVFFSLLIGLPTGIWLSRSERAASALRPFLDAMQTTPAFVYLVPIVMLFGIGNVPGVVVTIIFALPPLIRLTNLGIRQVPEDLIEATRSFGASPRQLLYKVQLPLAMPTILAGINQTLMLALSMVVIASMIAVGGLGQMVLRGIGRLDMGLATIGGIGIVVLAIILDRITQSMGRDARSRGTRHWYDTGPIGWMVRQFRK